MNPLLCGEKPATNSLNIGRFHRKELSLPSAYNLLADQKNVRFIYIAEYRQSFHKNTRFGFYQENPDILRFISALSYAFRLDLLVVP